MWSTESYGQKNFYTYILNLVVEDDWLSEITEYHDSDDLLLIMNNTDYQLIPGIGLQWRFFSEKGGDMVHYWGKNGQFRLTSKKCPKKLFQLSNKILEKIPSSMYLKHPCILIPSYVDKYDSLGLHHDRFNGNPEYVINLYIGSTMELYVETDIPNTSSVNQRSWSLTCPHGKLRIFHPMFNVLFKHAKKMNPSRKSEHYAISIREGDPHKINTVYPK